MIWRHEEDIGIFRLPTDQHITNEPTLYEYPDLRIAIMDISKESVERNILIAITHTSQCTMSGFICQKHRKFS